jgi:hypothetical protein
MKKLFLSLFIVSITFNSSLFARNNPVKIEFGSQEIFSNWGSISVPIIFITALDDLTIKKIVLNKGHCKSKFKKRKLILMENRYQTTVIKFPKKMNYAEEFNFEFECKNLMRVDVYTNKGTSTWERY